MVWPTQCRSLWIRSSSSAEPCTSISRGLPAATLRKQEPAVSRAMPARDSPGNTATHGYHPARRRSLIRSDESSPSEPKCSAFIVTGKDNRRGHAGKQRGAHLDGSSFAWLRRRGEHSPRGLLIGRVPCVIEDGERVLGNSRSRLVLSSTRAEGDEDEDSGYRRDWPCWLRSSERT